MTLVVARRADVELPLRPRMLRVVRREPRRELHPLRRAGQRRARSSSREAGARRRALGRGRRRRRARGRPAAPLRALLPRRPGAHEPRHGPRARDRQARRHVGRRDDGGDERARAVGSKIVCRFLPLVCARWTGGSTRRSTTSRCTTIGCGALFNAIEKVSIPVMVLGVVGALVRRAPGRRPQVEARRREAASVSAALAVVVDLDRLRDPRSRAAVRGAFDQPSVDEQDRPVVSRATMRAHRSRSPSRC